MIFSKVRILAILFRNVTVKCFRTLVLTTALSVGWAPMLGAVTPTAEGSLPRALGQVEIESKTPCGEQQCYEFRVTCPEVAAAEEGLLKVGEPTDRSLQGTVLLTTGGPGTRLFEEGSPHSKRLIDELRSAGLRTVQLQWSSGWLWGSADSKEGHARLACRPATVARWVYDELTRDDEGRILCAAGNSGGSAQISYMLTHYGLEEILSTVVPTGGPPMGRIDLACLRGNGATRELWFPNWATRIIDGGFGFPRDGSGPCAQGDASYREMFLEASVASGQGDYYYPETLVWFVFGGADTTGATAEGLTYYELLLQHGSPLVRKDILPGLLHGITSAPDGVNKTGEILVSMCRAR